MVVIIWLKFGKFKNFWGGTIPIFEPFFYFFKGVGGGLLLALTDFEAYFVSVRYIPIISIMYRQGLKLPPYVFMP